MPAADPLHERTHVRHEVGRQQVAALAIVRTPQAIVWGLLALFMASSAIAEESPRVALHHE